MFFTNKYMGLIRALSATESINRLKNSMYTEILNALKEYQFIDEYYGYQIVADIWNNSLNHDSEMIANAEFYTVGRMREPRMVTKGSGKNKHEERDGWNGVIVSNDIIRKLLYKDTVQHIEGEKDRLQVIEGELVQLAENALEEDTTENEVLFGPLSRFSTN